MSTLEVRVGQSDLGTNVHVADARSPLARGKSEIESGRELARLGVEELARDIHRRAASGRLNRGLSISLPYFDDAALQLRRREITIIPRGRVLFLPAFVVLAARREAERVSEDVSLSNATRDHLVEELRWLGSVFESGQAPSGATARRP